MNDRSPLTDQDRATLIAYLDGELEGEAARQVETRMSQDATWRAEMESYQRTWELLDFLPRAEPSAGFTNRTLARATIRPTPVITQLQKTWRQQRRWLGWAAAVILAATTGFAAVSWLAPRQPSDEDLVRDLRLIENKRWYEQVDNVDFLRELGHPDLFGEDFLEGS
jgi:anti-sigma factor RsiW